jgi:hypothetical protein
MRIGSWQLNFSSDRVTGYTPLPDIRRSHHSCRAQHFVGWNIDQRDKDDVRQGFESVEIIGLDRLRVTAGMA